MSIVKMGLAALAVTGFVAATVPATASSLDKAASQTAQVGAGDMTDFSAQRRGGRRYVRRGGGGGGAALAGAAAVGIIGSAIAAGAARDYYERPYYGPGYGSGYYGPQPYYGSGYYSRW